MTPRDVARLPVVLLICFFVGCGRGGKPAGLPQLHPCIITITMGSKPIDGAIIILAPQSGQWSASGTTDGNGSAVMKTQQTFDGVAAGKYNVGINKAMGTQDYVPDKSASYAEGQKAFFEARAKMKQVIPDHLTVPSLSPIEIEVVPGSNKIDIPLEKYPAEKYPSRLKKQSKAPETPKYKL